MADMAKEIINKKSEYAVSNDKVLMAIAGAFPSGLDYMEAFFCPSLEYICEKILNRTSFFFDILATLSSNLKVEMISTYLSCLTKCEDLLQGICILFILVPGLTILWMFYLIILLLLMAYLPFFMSYCLLWKVAAIFVPGIKNIELKKKEYEDAKKVLELVCQKIKDRHPDDCSSYELKELYSSPILLAACQDAYDVVDEILCRWPEAILCKDKNGYDIIQLATIYRSKKIYNLIYTLRMHNSTVYGNLEDFFKNNMLHLAGKLAPLNKLKLHTGAALQLQSELQWHQEVKKLVFPTFVTKENIFMETPEMMFTREHEYLVKEGEKWIKAVAESCSITAALIITIVFAAAITVPGGSSQNGVPVFTNETAFLIFALSDAISLFSSVTALLVFLSILTTRFAEKDYLVRLPIRLIIGLCTLLVSTTAMIVAFSATLFLVFCHQKLWMIAPICGLAFVPIVIFFILQFPLIVDLVRSTIISKFGKNNHHKSKFNPNDICFFVNAAMSGPRVKDDGSRPSNDPGVRNDGSRPLNDPGVRNDGSRASNDPGVKNDGSRASNNPGVKNDGSRPSNDPRKKDDGLKPSDNP